MNIADPDLLLNISELNFSTYFNGTFPILGTAKPALGEYLASPAGAFVHELDFYGITAAEPTQIFTDADYINTESGQIKTLDFTHSTITSIQECFRETKSVENFYARGTFQFADYAFFQSNIEVIVIGGEFSPTRDFAFYDCRYLHSITAGSFHVPTTPGQPSFGARSFDMAGVLVSGCVAHGPKSIP
jgi:hypothetical protein